MEKFGICVRVVFTAALLSPLPLFFNTNTSIDAASRDSMVDIYKRSTDSCSICTQDKLPAQNTLQDLVHVVWWGQTDSGIHDILYRKSSDMFDQSTMKLNNINENSIRPSIAAFGNNVHLVWVGQNNLGNSDTFYRKSSDGGATFSETVNLSNSPGNAFTPEIAVSGNNIHVVWSDSSPGNGNSDVFYRRSTDGGNTFSETVNLSNLPEGSTPEIALYKNNVYLVWQEDFPGPDEIFYRRSIDGGATFGPVVNLSINDGGSESPNISATKNTVHVVWRTNSDILYRRSIDGGATFGPVINLSNNQGSSSSPALAADHNNVYLVWEDTTGSVPDEFNSVHPDIFYRRSTSAGATFGNVINLSNNSGDSDDPDISADGNDVYVAWIDNTPGFMHKKFDILFLRSINDGSSFGSATNLSNDPQHSFSPRIAVGMG